MNSIIHIVDELTSLQIAGIITDEQQQRLDQIISESKEAFDFWKEKHALYGSVEAENVDNAYDQPAVLLKTWDKIATRRQGRIRRISGIAAAIVLLIGTSIFYVFERQNSAPAETAGQMAGNIQLHLPGGNTIDLSHTRGQVQIGNTTIINSNKSLSYTQAGTAPAGMATLSVPAGMDYTLELSDGSLIHLNAASSVKFPFTFSGKREITLEGEAYIKVASQAGTPFIVHLPHSSVEVLGTEFNINTYDVGKERVSLVKGAVRVKGKSQARLLKPGMEAVSIKGDSILTGTFDQDYTLGWTHGIYQFYDQSLEEICQVLPRWFAVKVVIDNPQIANERYSGQLDKNKSLGEQLHFFKITDRVDYYFKDSELHFR